MTQRLRVVSGSLRPFMPMIFAAHVEYTHGSFVSGSQRTAPSSRGHPELTTALRSSFSTKTESASSITNVGPHFVMDRNSDGPLIDGVARDRRARKRSTGSNVDLPLPASGEVTSSI